MKMPDRMMGGAEGFCDPFAKVSHWLFWGMATIDSGCVKPQLNFQDDRVPGSGVTEPAEGALRAKEDGHRGSWLTLS
ncbi:hypothetical protein ACQKF2_26695, partial [Pseudomonas hunanensis]|uniref:hypothetical protein n=1 Tax=Pseudomonas hunanensis TaxID=1247546 RepID=UPI003D0060E4